MTIRRILLYPDPLLRTKASEVDVFDADLRRLADDLAETMYAAPGVGLAATQLGVLSRVAVVDVDPKGPATKLHVFVNPRVVEREGKEIDTEGCLSIPDYTEKIERPQSIRVEARGVDGVPFALEASGFLARAICHEVDHLDGILFVDRLTGLRKELALRRLRKMFD